MHAPSYVCQRGNRYYFRRRIPRLSTYISALMVSLGTTDQKLAHRSGSQLNAFLDLMLDEIADTNLSAEALRGFLQVEMRSYLRSLVSSRRREHIDGSLNAAKARLNQLQAIVLKGIVTEGLTESLSEKVADTLSDDDLLIARDLHQNFLAEFLAEGFTASVAMKLRDHGVTATPTDDDLLQARWAVIEARMAAHAAVEEAPLHTAAASTDIARQMLADMLPQASQPMATAPIPETGQVLKAAAPDASPPPAPQNRFTPGVEPIHGDFTRTSVYLQLAQAEAQGPDNPLELDEPVFGTDIAGVAVRMIRKTPGNEETKKQILRSVALFMFTMRLQFVPDIKQHHFDRFADILKQMPSSYWKSNRQKEMTVQELLRDADLKPNQSRGLSRGTVEGHFATIRDVLKRCQREGSGTFFEPDFRTLLPADERDDTEKQIPFSQDDLKAVFMAPVWQGCKNKRDRRKPGSKLIRDHHYWVPLLLAYSGARRSEIAGLLTTDIGEENSIPFMYIRPNHLRGLKNKASKRRIPIHPHLIELGFLNHVEQSRKTKFFALFPGAIPRPQRALAKEPSGDLMNYKAKFGDGLHHVWHKTLNDVLGGNDEGYVMHSTRHYVNDQLINFRGKNGMDLLVPDIDRRDVMGHTQPDVNERTYRRFEKPLAPLYEAIKLLPRLF